MCDNTQWREQNFRTQGDVYGKMTYTGSGGVKVTGRLSNFVPGNTKLVFWAPSPPDYRTSYSGAGLPFADADMAYDQTPNAGTVNVNLDDDAGLSAGLQGARPRLRPPPCADCCVIVTCLACARRVLGVAYPSDLCVVVAGALLLSRRGDEKVTLGLYDLLWHHWAAAGDARSPIPSDTLRYPPTTR